jgi:hypothetical protein
MVAIVLGVAGLLVGLAAGYTVGTLHAGKTAAPSARSGATVSPTTISPFLITGTPGQVRLLCFVPAGAISTPQPLPTPVTTQNAHLRIIMILPASGQALSCRQ